MCNLLTHFLFITSLLALKLLKLDVAPLNTIVVVSKISLTYYPLLLLTFEPPDTSMAPRVKIHDIS